MTIKNILTLKFPHILVVLILLFLHDNAYGQFDTIRFSNGSKRAAKIIEISDKFVKYKNPLDTLGPTFSVKRKDVAGFILKNGCLTMEEQGYVDCVKDPTFDLVKDKDFTRKVVSVDAFQLANKHFQMNFDLIFKNKKNGIGLLMNIGLSDDFDRETYTRWETRILATGFYKKAFFGIDYKIFPVAHKRVTYFCALGFDYGKAYYQQVISDRPYKSKITDAMYFGYRFNNGIVCRITRKFVCQGLFTIGVNQFNYYSENKVKKVNSFSPKLVGSVLVGYAF